MGNHLRTLAGAGILPVVLNPVVEEGGTGSILLVVLNLAVAVEGILVDLLVALLPVQVQASGGEAGVVLPRVVVDESGGAHVLVVDLLRVVAAGAVVAIPVVQPHLLVVLLLP